MEGGLYMAKPDGGKHAHSEWKVLRVMHPCPEHSGQTLMEVEIHTGRPHQIRIHMASMGHPLVGDPLYGPGGVPKVNGEGGQVCNVGTVAKIGDCGYFLRAHKLEVYHPIDAQHLLSIEAPPCPPYSV
ncbi:pseudouridine synthase [Dunaliella salina]|nr:pseudouridine synthase [Dunaliella salina]|eukprot:KAF5840933.1 pseudouridine synthase [Dunaliella salina]